MVTLLLMKSEYFSKPTRVVRRLSSRPPIEASGLALHRRSAIYAMLLLCMLLWGTRPARAQTNVLTYHNDNSRSGLNPNETILNTANVNSNQFGKLFTQPVDGSVFAQPLYMANVNIPGSGTHNVVFVATEHDSVYAFDADNNTGANAAPLWKTSFLSSGVTTVPIGDTACPGISMTEVGITSTPVIDQNTGTLYVVAMTKESGSYVYRLHALDVTNGVEKLGGPSLPIQGSVPGGAGTLTFVPLLHLQRSALLLSNGVVYIEWASFCDDGVFHGWVMAYSASTLQQLAIFNDTPYGEDGGIWMSGNGAAADAAGNLFLVTGNGTFDASSSTPRDFGDSVVKLALSGGQISVTGYFSPYDELSMDQHDTDLGSGGELLLPDQSGSHPRLLVAGGKQGILYLLDRDNLGQFSNNGVSDPQVVQEVAGFGGLFSTPAYWNNNVYLWGSHDHLKTLALNNGLLSTAPIAQSGITYGFPGATPSISSNGNSNGIVWSLQSDMVGPDVPVYVGPTVLHAHDAIDVAVELYNSEQNHTRDQAGNAVKFIVPTVTSGKVYVGGLGQLNVYGLLPTVQVAAPTFSPAAGTVSSGQPVTISDTTSGASVFYTTDGSAPSTLSNPYTGPITVSSTTAINAIAVAAGQLNSATTSAVYNIQGSQGTITRVNQSGAGNYAGISNSISAPPGDHLAGNLLVVICRNGSFAISQTAATDTAGNTFVGLAPVVDGNVGVLQMWYAKNINGNANNVVTCHFASPDSWQTISVLQYAGADPNNPLDSQVNANSGTAKATSGVAPAVTASETGDLVVVGTTVGATGKTFSPGSGFTLRDSSIATFSGDEDQVVTVAGTVVPSMSWGPGAQFWAMVAAAFKPATTGSLVSIAVTPGSSSIGVGLSEQFTATGTYSDGSTQNLTNTVTWNSATPAVATISATGVATAVGSGTSSITATSNGITSNSAVLTATPPTLVSIAVTPASSSIGVGLAQQFTATGTYTDGSTQNLTTITSWNSGTPAVATISATGLATGVRNGTSAITATAGGITSNSVSLTVGPTAAITLVNNVSAGNATTNKYGSIAAPAANHMAGNLLVVICRNGNNLISQTAPTDTAGNTFVGLTPATDANLGVIQMWYAKNITGKANNVVSCNYASPDGWQTIGVLQYTGVDHNSPLDSQANANSGTAKATSGVTPAVTASETGDLVVVGTTVGATGMAFSAGSGFTLRDSAIATFSGDEDLIATVAGPVVPSMSWGPSSQLWAMVAAVFKPTASTSLVSIGVTPGSSSIVAGLTQQFTATGTYSDGSTQNLTNTATWHSGTSTVATISAAGLATGVGNGASAITAASAGITSNSAMLTVTPPTLVSIAVTPASSSVGVGLTQQFTATGTYTDGSTQNLTVMATWNSGTPAVATISATGLATGISTGTSAITATVGGITSNSATLGVGATPITLVNHVSAGNATANKFSSMAAPAANHLAGNLLAVICRNGNSLINQIAPTDTAGNTFVGLTPATDANLGEIQMWYAKNIKGNANNVVSCHYASPDGWQTVSVLQYAGVDPSYPLDSQANANAETAKATSGVTPKVAPRTGGLVVIGATVGATGMTFSSGSGFTLRDSSIATFSGDEDQIATVGGPVVPSISWGPSMQLWAMVAAALKPATSASLVSIAVTPANFSVALGAIEQFSATGTFSDGSTQNLTPSVTWNSGTSAVATISATGAATSVGNGTSLITATSSGITSNSAVLTVTPPALVSITVTPASSSIAKSLTQQFTATGIYTDGSTQNLTALATWNSGTPAVATISAAGVATGIGTGTSAITATVGGVTSNSALLAVGPTAPITLVNHVSAGNATGNKFGAMAAPAANHLAGNLLVVICRNGNNLISQTAPTDTAGNTFVGLTPTSDANLGVIQMWYAKNINGNANNVVSCHYASPDGWQTVSVLQYAGADPNSPLDSQANANGGAAKATSGFTTAVTSSRIGGLVVTGATVGATGLMFSAGSGFTLRDSAIATFSGDEDQSITAAGPMVPSMSWGPSQQLWAMVAAAFR